jgi:hypothetical protein
VTLELSDILDIARYESVRPDYRQRVIEHKAARRVEVGESVSLTFEDRETVRYQIQEMARVERLVDPRRIAHEIEVYAELLPTERELAATLFIQIPEMDRIRDELDRLLGIDECVVLEIGDGGGSSSVRAVFDERQLEEDRISAVHYLRFPLSAAQRERLLGGAPARIVIDHPAYHHSAELSPETRASLCRDLAGTTPRLLDPASVPEGESGERLIEERGAVRVLEPASKARSHHLVVAASDPGATLADCDTALLAELFETARSLAAELARRGIPSQIVANLAADGSEPARVLVLSVDG